MKVAIVGANGQLGSDLCKIFAESGHSVSPLTHEDIEIENIDSVAAVLGTIHPDVILNTAAFHVVPKCENEPGRSYEVNALGALNIARVSAQLGARPVYFSTDYVFDGAKHSPYEEKDSPNPLNVYAVTKLAGEYFTLNYSHRGIVIRVSGIYGKTPCRAKGGNFITTMLRLAKENQEVRVVRDEILTPTPTYHIALKTLSLLKRDGLGLFHLTCEGECSWYEFARTIFETMNIKTQVTASSVKDTPSPVRRPHYSVLQNSSFNHLTTERMPDWKEAVEEFLRSNYL
jgi:dTDP-4-dehydrorhamnose reductase